MAQENKKKLKSTLFFSLIYGGIIVFVIGNTHAYEHHLMMVFVEFMSDLIPSIVYLSNKSELPVLVGVYFSSMWVIVPFVAARIAWVGLIVVPDFEVSKFETISLLIVIPIILTSFIFLLGSSESSFLFSRVESAMVSNKIMLVLVGGALMWVVSALAAILLQLLAGISKTLINN